jgi:hypothetical protein
MKTLFISLIMAAGVSSFAQSTTEWEARTRDKVEQGKKENAQQERFSGTNRALGSDATAKAQEVKAEAGQYSANMRYANFLERATNQVPRPEKVSELYLKDLGEFKVTCQTNRRSGTIEYRVVGSTNLALAFSSLRQMPNRTRISQGTNSVTVVIKLPTAQ